MLESCDDIKRKGGVFLMFDQDHQPFTKECMSNDNVSELKNPWVANEVGDVLTEVLREGRARCWRRPSR